MADIALLAPRSIAGIASLRDVDRLHVALQEEFGAEVPVRAGFVQLGAVTLACVAPGRFIAAGAMQLGLPQYLARRLDGAAAVTDQSDMWVAWQVSGAGARECLARVVPVDLGPDIFRIGDLALTRAGHLDVRVCRVASDGYEIAVTRSVAADLLHALERANTGPSA